MSGSVSFMAKEPPVERALLIWYTAKGKKRMFIVPIDRNKRFMLMDVGDRFLDDKHLKKDVISKLKTVRKALAKPKEDETYKKKSKSEKNEGSKENKSSKKKMSDLDFNEISNKAMKKSGKKDSKEKQEKDKKKSHKNDTKEEMSQKLIELSKEDINTRGVWFKHRIKHTRTLVLRDILISMVIVCGSSRPD